MARGPKAAESRNDGMGWLALMPFPALNPLNWGALAAPRNVMLASLNNAQLALDAWRASADGMRALMRLQQDEALKMLQAPLDAIEESVPAAEPEADGSAEQVSAATLFVRPMVEVTRAYSQVGRAFIVAQRDTMRAMTQTAKPH